MSDTLKYYAHKSKLNLMSFYYHKRHIINPLVPQNHIVISGEPRGGTTWLAELLLEIDKTNLVWEPLRKDILEKYSQSFNQSLGELPHYLSEKNDWEKSTEYFDRLFKGQFLPTNIFQKKVPKLLSTGEWIFKFCRANPMLPWLVRRYNFKTIYLVRHPLAVIASQFRHPAFDSMVVENNFLCQPRFDNSLLEMHRSTIDAIKTRSELFAVWWALSNLIPYQFIQEKKGNWLTISYEKLVTDPHKELKRVFKFLGKQVPDGINQKLKEPSFTTRKGAEILTGGNQLAGWKKTFKPNEAESLIKLINRIGVHAYNTELIPDYRLLGYNSL